MKESIEQFVAAMAQPAKPKNGANQRLQHVADDIQARLTNLDTQFRDEKVLDAFLSARPDREKLYKGVTRAVSGMSDVVARLEKSSGDDPELARLSQRSVTEQYRVLVTRGHLDPATLIDDIPEAPTLCEISRLASAVKEGSVVMPNEALQRQLAASLSLFASRWLRITGTPYNAKRLPTVGELTRFKAPVPLTPAWTSRLYAREAVALNAEPPADPADEPAPPDIPEPPADEPPEEPGPEDGQSAPNGCVCDANAILERFGIPTLAPPKGSEPRYSFPGRLLQREEIYYDYAVIVPVDECGPFGPEVSFIQQRSLSAARAIAGEALGILDFLSGLGLDTALGSFPAAAPNGPGTVITELYDFLLALLNGIGPNSAPSTVRDRKNRCREYAALVRAAARRQIFLGRVAGQDPRDFFQALDTALAGMPPYTTFREDTFAYDPAPEGRDLSTYLEVNGLRIGNVRDVYGNMCLDNNEQVRTLKPYMEYLGGEFYNRLRALQAAAIDMRNAVQSFQGNASQVQSDFQHMAAGKINEAAFVLARLLDDLAETLPLWARRRGEGSKRLAMLMIYRQYWNPEGYVKGKLVGYKNLIPAQKEKIRRRTFIQTTRERTTVEEFAASRQQDFSQSRKETSELLRENSTKFNFSSSVSGGFDFSFGSVDIAATTALDIASLSRATQSSVAEMSMKAAFSYNEKREVKIREETQVQEEFESELSLENPNQEITANYFYYQLLRQYSVTVELHDIRPVLLRTRFIPSEASIDDKFLGDYAHVLVHALPAQLAADLVESVSDIEAQARRVLRTQSEVDSRELAYLELRAAPPAATPEEARDRENRLVSLREAADRARESLTEADELHLRSRGRLDRVIGHVRDNLTHYMQFIWQASPRTDEERILRDESFHGVPLPQLTRGLQRQGYYGDEDIFEFTGESVALAEALVRTLTPGSDLATLSEEELRATALFQQLSRQYSEEEVDDLIAAIRRQSFVTDPADPDTVLSSRHVQIAQDALVVETLPGQVPLLEGYKMAHRLLDIERACLENDHLSKRIEDRPWTQGGEDTYRVYRRDGQPLPANEEGEP
jgi:hypothetical protein